MVSFVGLSYGGENETQGKKFLLSLGKKGTDVNISHSFVPFYSQLHETEHKAHAKTTERWVF